MVHIDLVGKAVALASIPVLFSCSPRTLVILHTGDAPAVSLQT